MRELLLLAGAAAAFWAFRHWRRGLRAVLVLLVVEGAVRKWLLPEAQDLVYFAKDVLLVGVYAGFWNDARRPRSRVPLPLQGALVAGVAYGVLELFNPSLPNVLVGLLGLKAYYFYSPLLWIVPSAFASVEDLAAFVRRYVLLSIPVGVLAVAQFFSGPEAMINAYARGGAAAGGAATFGSSTFVRVTGTFSYISGFSSYLLANVILVLALLAATRWRLRENLATYVALALSLLGMFMTGSRGPVLMLILLFPLYGWLGLMRERGRDATLGRLLLGLGLVAALVNYVGSDAISAFYGRAAGSSDVAGRILAPLTGPVELVGEVGLAGFGIGSTHQTAEAVTRGIEPYSWLRGLLAEDEPSRVMLELGPLGFALQYFLRVYLVVLALGQVFRLSSSFLRAIATSCVLFLLAHLPGGVVFNVTADVYYWFFAGLLLLAVRLDRGAAPEAGVAPQRWRALRDGDVTAAVERA